MMIVAGRSLAVMCLACEIARLVQIQSMAEVPLSELARKRSLGSLPLASNKQILQQTLEAVRQIRF